MFLPALDAKIFSFRENIAAVHIVKQNLSFQENTSIQQMMVFIGAEVAAVELFNRREIDQENPKKKMAFEFNRCSENRFYSH
jgi:hypothetical protein